MKKNSKLKLVKILKEDTQPWIQNARTVAKDILKKFGNNPETLVSVIKAASAAGMGQPQKIFPPGLDLKEEGFMEIEILLGKHLGAPGVSEGGVSREFYQWLEQQ